jgi:hypothetical protein
MRTRLLVYPALVALAAWSALVELKTRGLLPEWATWTHVHLAPAAAWPVLTALAAAFGVGGFRYSPRTLVIFLLLETCAEALGLHWEPWTVLVRLEPDVRSLWYEVHFPDPEGERLQISARRLLWKRDEWMKAVAFKEVFTYESDTGRCLNVTFYTIDGFKWGDYNGPRMTPELGLSPDGKRVLELRADGGRDSLILRDTLGRKLATIRKTIVGVPAARFSVSGKRLACIDQGGVATVYRRRRPEWWWGVFYLKELWATVIFAAFFAWSLWRDRRYFKVLDARLVAALAEKAARAAAKAQGGSG